MVMQDQRRASFLRDFRDFPAEDGIAGEGGILKPNQRAKRGAALHHSPESALNFSRDDLWSLCLIRKIVAGRFLDKIGGQAEGSQFGAFAFSSSAEQGDPFERGACRCGDGGQC